MELNADWKSFQNLFYPQREMTGSPGQSDKELHAAVLVVTDGTQVLSAQADGEELTAWSGQPLDRLLTELSHRDFMIFDQTEVASGLTACLALPHFHDQMEMLRASVKPAVRTTSRFKADDLMIQRHFLLEALLSWWARLLPKSYGILLQIDPDPESAAATPGAGVPGRRSSRVASGVTEIRRLFLIVRNGRIESFQEPDLPLQVLQSVSHTGRGPELADWVKALSERHVLPVQALRASRTQWSQWSRSRNPWPQIAQALRAEKASYKVVPARWGVRALVGLRALLGV